MNAVVLLGAAQLHCHMIELTKVVSKPSDAEKKMHIYVFEDCTYIKIRHYEDYMRTKAFYLVG